MEIQWLAPEKLSRTVQSAIVSADIVLDIGCGIRPQQLITPKVHLCCDPYKPYLEYLRDEVIPDKSDSSYVLLHADWAEVLQVLPERSVDTVFLLDVVEHLEKPEGENLLARTEKLARQQIVIFTPQGFLPQQHPDGIDAWGMGGGKWQEHKSGWEPEDFVGSWEIYASKDYIKTDNKGRRLRKPQGAFWAIKTFNQESSFVQDSLTKAVVSFRNISNFFSTTLHRVVEK